MNQKTFYITTTLPYVNADLHMGHALEFVRADIIARHKKLLGYDVFFNTGTDEHGMKIYEKAVSAGQTPQEFVDEGFSRFKESIRIFGIMEDAHFVRTTDQRHINAAKEFWKRVYDAGYIYKKDYQAKYCVGCESDKTDSDLVNGECPDHPGRTLEIINEQNYFFKYSAFNGKLLSLYESSPDFVVPDFRFNEIKAFVKKGLQDFSISRLKAKMPWGIEVPGDEEHVMYVWFDALVSYISTLDWPKEDNFEKYWVSGEPTQYCGKDNLRFQSAMWQAMLMAAGLPNSRRIIINGFITAEGGLKMSKTLGNVVDPKEIAGEYGTDALRLFLLKEINSFEDSPFSMERFKESYNANLANGLGNLTSRIMKMSEANLEKIKVEDLEIVWNQYADKKDTYDFLDKFDIKKSVDCIWQKISNMDVYIQTSEPFKLIKTDRESGIRAISILVKDLYIVAKMLEPFLPETSEKIKKCILENKMPEAPLFLRK